MTGLTQNKALYPFIKSINTDNLCEDFGNISNDNKRQRTMMCPLQRHNGRCLLLSFGLSEQSKYLTKSIVVGNNA